MPYPYDTQNVPDEKKPKQEINWGAVLVFALLFSIAISIAVFVFAPSLLNNQTPPSCSAAQNASYQEGYAKAINETQNKNILLGYCAAQVEFLNNSRMLGNTTMVAPVSVLKSVCFTRGQ